jgi:hypothetical protein
MVSSRNFYISNIVHPTTAVPTELASNKKQHMYQFLIEGSSFELDNQAVYPKLEAFLIDSPGWAWIKPHDAVKNGRNAYLACGVG